VVSILLAGAAGFAFDDPAAEILAASPSPLRRRRMARLALIGPPIYLRWGTAVVIEGPRVPLVIEGSSTPRPVAILRGGRTIGVDSEDRLTRRLAGGRQERTRPNRSSG
jgi:hypothetical protein